MSEERDSPRSNLRAAILHAIGEMQMDANAQNVIEIHPSVPILPDASAYLDSQLITFEAQSQSEERSSDPIVYSTWFEVFGRTDISDETIQPYREAMNRVLNANPPILEALQEQFSSNDDWELLTIQALPALFTREITQPFAIDQEAILLAHALALTYRTYRLTEEFLEAPAFLDMANALLQNNDFDEFPIDQTMSTYILTLQSYNQSQEPVLYSPGDGHNHRPEQFPSDETTAKAFIQYAIDVLYTKAAQCNTPFILPQDPRQIWLNEREIVHILGGAYSKGWVNEIRDRYDLATAVAGSKTTVYRYRIDDLMRLIALQEYEREGKHVHKKVLFKTFTVILEDMYPTQ